MFQDKNGYKFVFNDVLDITRPVHREIGQHPYFAGRSRLRTVGGVDGEIVYFNKRGDRFVCKGYADGAFAYATKDDCIAEATDAVSNAKTARTRFDAKRNLRLIESNPAAADRIASFVYLKNGKLYTLAPRVDTPVVAAPQGLRELVAAHTGREMQSGVDVTDKVVDALMQKVCCVTDLYSGNFGLELDPSAAARASENITALAHFFNVSRAMSSVDLTASEYANGYAADAFALATAVENRGVNHYVNPLAVSTDIVTVVSSISGIDLNGQAAAALRAIVDDFSTMKLTQSEDAVLAWTDALMDVNPQLTNVGSKVVYTVGANNIAAEFEGGADAVRSACSAYKRAAVSAYMFMYDSAPTILLQWAGLGAVMKEVTVE